MNRFAMIIVGGAVGSILGAVAITTMISITSPNNYRDSGMPNFAVGILLGCPGGLLVGLIVGAILPVKR